MSEFLENECKQHRSLEAPGDPLASKYREIGIAAVAAALRVMDRTIPKPRMGLKEPRSETVMFLRDDI